MKVAPVPIMIDLSMATSETSIGISVDQYFAASIQASWTGAPVGAGGAGGGGQFATNNGQDGAPGCAIITQLTP